MGMRILISLLLVMWALPVMALNFSLKWLPPTQYENGAPLALDQIAGYSIDVVMPSGQTVNQFVSAPAANLDFETAEYGIHAFSLSTVLVDGLRSDSVTVSHSNKTPASPPGFTVEVVCEAGANCTFNLGDDS